MKITTLIRDGCHAIFFPLNNLHFVFTFITAAGEGFAQVPCWEGAEPIQRLFAAELGISQACPSQGRIWNKGLVERRLQNIHRLPSSLQLPWSLYS